MEPTSQDAIVEGARVKLNGRVVAEATLVAPLSEKPCVAYEVRAGLTDAAAGDVVERGAVDFWLEVGGDKVLVRAMEVELLLASHPFDAAVRAVDADLEEIGRTLHQLKAEMRSSAGDAHKRLAARMQILKRIATVGCTLRAHARNRIHGGRFRSLTLQAAFLKKEREQMAQTVPQVAVERFEALIAAGDKVTVDGMVASELDPDGSAGGYRDAATRTVLVGSDDAPLRILTEGGVVAARERKSLPQKRNATPKSRTGGGSVLRWVIGLGAVYAVFRFLC